MVIIKVAESGTQEIRIKYLPENHGSGIFKFLIHLV
jgi:hypothetical protein